MLLCCPSCCVHVTRRPRAMVLRRFQPFELEICRDLLREIPLFFVINKVDTAEVWTWPRARVVLCAMHW